MGGETPQVRPAVAPAPGWGARPERDIGWRMNDFDVIVAGAGMTGASAALALASGGLRVAVIDPRSFSAQVDPNFDGRASAVAYSSFRCCGGWAWANGLRRTPAGSSRSW
jgi:hypothetical protein